MSAAILVILLVGYLHLDADDTTLWNRAASDQRLLLDEAHTLLPHPPAGATIYVRGSPAQVEHRVPVLGTALDLTSALRLSFRDASLTGVPLSGAGGLRCGAETVIGNGSPARYGHAYLLDVARERLTALANNSDCRRL
jgi:hypothetical protein